MADDSDNDFIYEKRKDGSLPPFLKTG